MSAIAVEDLSYRYGRRVALEHLDLLVQPGEVYALLGPNGAGKSTLLQILAGVRRSQQGKARVLGSDVRSLSVRDRQRIGVVAEGQALPAWMRLEQWESYLAPLYPTWDHALASDLRERFGLDPRQRLGSLSRGTAMKAALLGALAPRPELLLMDEPFTGMDVLVKDELVRGLLDTAATEGWTIVVSTHDIAEVELLADHVGLLRNGRVQVSDSLESLQARHQHVEIVGPTVLDVPVPPGAMRVERSSHRLSFCVTGDRDIAWVASLRSVLPADARVDVRSLSLRELFVLLAGAAEARVA